MIDDGSAFAHVFAGKDILITEVHVIISDKKFASALSDSTRQCNSMDTIISYRAQVKLSNKVKGILRALIIDN